MGVASLRQHFIMEMSLAAEVGEQIGIISDQFRALVHGGVVIFSRDQLQSFGLKNHPDLPEDLSTHAHWALTGESNLVAVD